MCTIRGREADAVRVYLTGLYHCKDVRRKFLEVRENLDRGYLLSLLRKLPLEKDERRYLRQRIIGGLVR
jgi:hypothetical protein